MRGDGGEHGAAVVFVEEPGGAFLAGGAGDGGEAVGGEAVGLAEVLAGEGRSERTRLATMGFRVFAGRFS